MNRQIAGHESFLNRCAFFSREKWRFVLTTRPEAVKLGQLGGKCHHYLDEVHRVHGSVSYEQIFLLEVDESRLLPNDFVAVLSHVRDQSGGKTAIKEFVEETLFGREVRDEDLFFGSAYADWARRLEPEAYSFLEEKVSDHPTRLKRTLRFASGRAHDCAPHYHRLRAWKVVLRVLGASGDLSKIVRSARTATAKAALRLGWEPSEPQPEYWEEFPEGVVKLAPPETSA